MGSWRRTEVSPFFIETYICFLCRFLNLTYIPPSPNLWAAIGACEGGRCPGTLGGAIKSPGYPLNYPDKQDVTYTLETYKDTKIELKFDMFDLEESNNQQCSDGDYVRISQRGRNHNSPYFCGKTNPPVFKSFGNKMVVQFFSDFNLNARGFLATWKEVLPKNLIDGQTEGELRTPNYPNKYPRNARVRRYFVIPQNSRIEFRVIDFQTELGYDKLCVFGGALTKQEVSCLSFHLI